jgi:hypothetical protein
MIQSTFPYWLFQFPHFPNSPTKIFKLYKVLKFTHLIISHHSQWDAPITIIQTDFLGCRWVAMYKLDHVQVSRSVLLHWESPGRNLVGRPVRFLPHGATGTGFRLTTGTTRVILPRRRSEVFWFQFPTLNHSTLPIPRKESPLDSWVWFPYDQEVFGLRSQLLVLNPRFHMFRGIQ